jgi:hypothetical protein
VNDRTRFQYLRIKKVERHFKHSNEPFNSIKIGRFIDELRDSQHLKKDALGTVKILFIETLRTKITHSNEERST